MGQRITQRILECSKCGKIPEDGENLWQMGVEIWCEECTLQLAYCEKEEDQQEDLD